MKTNGARRKHETRSYFKQIVIKKLDKRATRINNVVLCFILETIIIYLCCKKSN